MYNTGLFCCVGIISCCSLVKLNQRPAPYNRGWQQAFRSDTTGPKEKYSHYVRFLLWWFKSRLFKPNHGKSKTVAKPALHLMKWEPPNNISYSLIFCKKVCDNFLLTSFHSFHYFKIFSQEKRISPENPSANLTPNNFFEDEKKKWRFDCKLWDGTIRQRSH